MVTQIPSLGLIRRRLQRYSMAELEELSESSGVPFSTLLKIKLGTTGNPGIETCRKFWPYLKPEPKNGKAK
jgi:hypothetical protein